MDLHLWSRVAGIDGVVIDLEKLLAPEVVVACMVRRFVVEPVGYAEDADVIFIDVYASFYMIHLNSMKIEEVSAKRIGSAVAFFLTLASMLQELQPMVEMIKLRKS